jgi:hypothetical protein
LQPLCKGCPSRAAAKLWMQALPDQAAAAAFNQRHVFAGSWNAQTSLIEP